MAFLPSLRPCCGMGWSGNYYTQDSTEEVHCDMVGSRSRVAWPLLRERCPHCGKLRVRGQVTEIASVRGGSGATPETVAESCQTVCKPGQVGSACAPGRVRHKPGLQWLTTTATAPPCPADTTIWATPPPTGAPPRIRKLRFASIARSLWMDSACRTWAATASPKPP